MKQFVDPKLNEILRASSMPPNDIIWTRENSETIPELRSFATAVLIIGIVWSFIIVLTYSAAALGGGMRETAMTFLLFSPVIFLATFGPPFFGYLLVRRLNKFAYALSDRSLFISNAAWPRFSRVIRSEHVQSIELRSKLDREYLYITTRMHSIRLVLLPSVIENVQGLEAMLREAFDMPREQTSESKAK